MTKSVRDGFFCLGTDLLPTKNRRVTTQERTFKKSLHTSRSATGEHTAPPPPCVAFVPSGVAPSIARDDSKVFSPDFHRFARVHASPASSAATITTIVLPQSPPRLRARRRSRMHDRVRSFVRSRVRSLDACHRARKSTPRAHARSRPRSTVRPRARARVPPAPPRDARFVSVQPWSVAAARRAFFQAFATLFRTFRAVSHFFALFRTLFLEISRDLFSGFSPGLAVYCLRIRGGAHAGGDATSAGDRPGDPAVGVWAPAGG